MTNTQAYQFGYSIERLPTGWYWRAYDDVGKTRSSGLAPTRASAAAHIIVAHAGYLGASPTAAKHGHL